MADPVAPSRAFNIYPLANYSHVVKEQRKVNYISNRGRLERMKAQYPVRGMRRSVQGILMAWVRDHPFVFLLKNRNNAFELPGGLLRSNETDIDGLRRKLSNRLDPPDHPINWQIGECVARWSRPTFENIVYPFPPNADITMPKECLKIYMVQLPERLVFHVPRNLTSVAVPLYSLYTEGTKYGIVPSHVPSQLSRFQFNMKRNP